MPGGQTTAHQTPAAGLDTSAAQAAVSVILPTFNRVELLAASLDSVAAQTFSDYQIIVVDDGSTDGTREYVQSRREPIVYCYQENQGVAEARNHALRLVHSEFVAFLDSDDLWKPRFLEASVRRLREDPGLDLVFSRFTSTDPDGRVLPRHNKRSREGDITAPLFASTFIHTSSVVARAHVIRAAGGFDGRLSHNEDYDLWLRLSMRHRFGLIPEPLCLRRCHPNSLSHNGCTADVLLRKAHLLEHFYEHGGGREKIAPAPARRRLGHVFYTAGKALYRHGRAPEAAAAMKRALELAPLQPKAWFWYALAAARRERT